MAEMFLRALQILVVKIQNWHWSW